MRCPKRECKGWVSGAPLGHLRQKADLRENVKRVRGGGGGGWRRAPRALPILHHHPIIIPQPHSPSHTRHPIISSGEAVPAVGTKSYPIICSPTPTRHHPPNLAPPQSHAAGAIPRCSPLWPPKALPAHNTLASGRRRPPAHNIPFHHHPPFPPHTPSSRLQLEPGLTSP